MYKRPVATDIKQTEELVDATFGSGESERQRHEDEVSRARFDESIARKRPPSVIERVLRWVGRRR